MVASSYSAGSAFIDILPSLRGFAAKLKRELAGVHVGLDVPLDVVLDSRAMTGVQRQLRNAMRTLPAIVLDADSSPADRVIAALRSRMERLVGQTIGLDVSGDQARGELNDIQAQLDRLSRESPDIGVRVDAGAASAALAGVEHQARGLDGRNIRLRVDADVARAVISLAQLALSINAFANHEYHFSVEADTFGAVASIAALVAKVGVLGGLAGVVGGFGGALGGLGAAGAVAGAGLASTVVASLGVGDALSALSAQQDAAATSARQNAKQQQAAGFAIASAQDRVKQAAADAGRARVEGERSVADAVKSSGRQIEQAEKAQATAQRTLRQTTTDLKREQDSLTDAWEAGRRSLQDLQSQVNGNSLDQRQAAIDLRDAQKELAAAKGTGNADAIERAQIAYDRQVQTVKDLQTQGRRLSADNAVAVKAGVAGSDQVVAANERIAAATERQSDSTAALREADANLVQARTDGADQVARAREQADLRVQASDRQVVEAQRALTQALAQTGDAGAAAADKVATAMADLSPEAQAFVKFLFAAKTQLQDVSKVASSQFFPPVQAGLQALLDQEPAIAGMVGKLAGATGGALGTILTTLANPTWMSFFGVLADASTTILPALAQLFLHGADAARQLLEMLLPLAPAGIQLANQFLDLFQAVAPFLVQMLGGLIPAASLFLAALAPLGPVFTALQPILLVLAQVFAQVLLVALQALTPILIALTPLIQEFAVQWGQGLVDAITTAAPLLIAIFTFLSDHADTVVRMVTVVGGLVGAFKPLLWVLGLVATALHGWLILRIAGAALTYFGLQGTLVGSIIMRLLSPIQLLRLALPFIGRAIMFVGRAILGAMGPFGILLTVLGYLFTSNEQFRTAIQGVLQVLLGLAQTLIAQLMPAFNAIWGAIQPLIPLLVGALMPIINVLAAVLVDLVNTVMPPLVQILTSVVIPIIVTLANILATVLVWVIQNVVVPAIQFLAWLITNVLVPVITWLYENIIKPIFTAIGALAVWLFSNVIKPEFDSIVWVLNNILGPAFLWLWDNVIRPSFTAAGALIMWVWDNVIHPAFDAISGGLDWLGQGFQFAVDHIGDIWNGLRNLLAVPINFLIGTVFNDGIRVAWNFVADLLPGIDPINPLPLIPEFATGGLLRGPGTGTSDSMLAVGPTGTPVAKVSNGEFVVNADTTRKTLPFLTALNGGNGEALQAAGGLNRVAKVYRGPKSGFEAYARGGLVGYAAGGPIDERVMQAKKWLSGTAPGIPYAWGGTVTPNMAGTDCSGMQAAVTHILSGRSPYSGRIGTTASMPWGGFASGQGAYTIGNKPSDHMAATLAGDNVEQHGPAGTPFSFPSRWGADNGYFTQQFALQQLGGQFVSGGSGGGGINWILQQVKDVYTSATDPLLDLMSGFMGPPPPAFRSVPVEMTRKIRDDIGTFLFGEAEQAGGNGMDVSGITGPVQDQVREVAKRYGWDTGPEWTALSKLIEHESGWNPNAANPSSSARGLFQKMTSIHGPVESTPAGQAVWGLDYISGRYNDPLNAWNFWQSHHSYDEGGIGKGIGWMWKGTGLDERVLPPQETQAYPTLTRLSQQLEAGRLPVPTGVSDRQYAAALSGSRGGEGERGGDTFHLHGLDHYTPRRVATEVQRVRDFDERLT